MTFLNKKQNNISNKNKSIIIKFQKNNEKILVKTCSFKADNYYIVLINLKMVKNNILINS